MLTDRDRELILLQCEHQSANTPIEVERFTQAYTRAKKFAFGSRGRIVSSGEILKLVKELGAITDPRNRGWRKVTVVFASGNRALPPEFLGRAMEQWAKIYAEQIFLPEDSYREFEDIHPFLDGNGRVGDLLWKISMKWRTGVWPIQLPPDIFNERVGVPRVYKSAFGDIES